MKRVRNSLYLSELATQQLQSLYKKIEHALYPATLSKATFLEISVQFLSDHQQELLTLLTQGEEHEICASIDAERHSMENFT